MKEPLHQLSTSDDYAAMEAGCVEPVKVAGNGGRGFINEPLQWRPLRQSREGGTRPGLKLGEVLAAMEKG